MKKVPVAIVAVLAAVIAFWSVNHNQARKQVAAPPTIAAAKWEDVSSDEGLAGMALAEHLHDQAAALPPIQPDVVLEEPAELLEQIVGLLVQERHVQSICM